MFLQKIEDTCGEKYRKLMIQPFQIWPLVVWSFCSETFDVENDQEGNEDLVMGRSDLTVLV